MFISKGSRAIDRILTSRLSYPAFVVNSLLVSALLIGALLSSGCAPVSPQESEQASPSQDLATTHSPFAEFPAVFAGTLPCASCPGIDYQLLLHSNQSYLLRRHYQDRTPGTFDSIGQWRLDDNTLTLSENDGNQMFQLLDQGDLELLDPSGQIISSNLNYRLTRQEDTLSRQFALPLQGQFTYMADAASFVECTTGLRFPVAMQEAYLSVEKAYLGARLTPAEPLLIHLVARIESLSDMEETRLQPTLVVQQLITLWPGQPCPE
ncbi:copper resistance protein NlpE N-terminal domain-containing protein [Nitrincola sp. MINF-07-Sa-05]|uniref:copper resistance protein NlpE N-terminal domain-containing protein n=1 Tax=Nitrincola salilacus TaxID=3400273 RepID=UPI003917D736